MNIDAVYNAVKKMAETFANEKNLKLAEVCDFGDSVGFIFETKDKYSNVYWCVDKETYKPYTFVPNQDMEKYANRKILDASIIKAVKK